MKKNILKYVLPLSLFVLWLSGCGDFEAINTNKQGVTHEMAQRDGVAAGGHIQTLERTAVPVGTAADGTDLINAYQIAYHIGQDTWAGYFGQNAAWSGGINHTTYNLVNAWVRETYTQSYTNAFAPWLAIKNSTDLEKNPENYALAQILKIAVWHKATDTFGPVPYTKAGSGLFVTPYDSQETVYKSMLEDLENAIDVLTNYEKQGGRLFPDYDLIYAGNTTKWVKFANSLMLRLAMRMRYVAMEESRKYAEKAVNHSIGVMKDVEDGATIGFAHGLQFENPIERFAGQYAECRMGTPAFIYLAGYKDPRLPKYYKTSEHSEAIQLDWAGGKYLPIPPGAGINQDDKNANSFYFCSLPNIDRTTPIRWLLTSEVLFLQAEAVLFGWNMGGKEAASLYRQGIETSFAENGIPISEVNAYMNSGLKPAAVDMSNVRQVYRVFSINSEATVKFDGTTEQKLEKINIQKWIALYPNGQEAWSEWRRTGYPEMPSVMRNTSGGIINDKEGMRRMHYSIIERSKDEQEVYDEAVQLLGGPDLPSTKLWWDKK